jgi:hypothetical protein
VVERCLFPSSSISTPHARAYNQFSPEESAPGGGAVPLSPISMPHARAQKPISPERSAPVGGAVPGQRSPQSWSGSSKSKGSEKSDRQVCFLKKLR